MKLLVRNLDRSTTEEELKDVFEEFGAVQSCNIVLDRGTGLSKGFGFIEMPKAGEAKAAVKNLNQKLVGKNAIRVKKAEAGPDKTRSDRARSDQTKTDRARSEQTKSD